MQLTSYSPLQPPFSDFPLPPRPNDSAFLRLLLLSPTINSFLLPVNPLSAFEFDPLPPHAPLFPLYIPLFSLDPAVPPSESASSVLPLPRDIFGLPLRRDILHSCVVHHLNLLKRGTTHTKNRAEVRGSGKKLHRQKGTGRARVADSGSGIRQSLSLPLSLPLPNKSIKIVQLTPLSHGVLTLKRCRSRRRKDPRSALQGLFHRPAAQDAPARVQDCAQPEAA